MSHDPDCIGMLSLLPTNEGGRADFVVSGYRPQHLIHENYQTSGVHEYIGVQRLAPGESAAVKVWFVTREVYPKSLWPGRVIGVLEGSRRVGTLQITEVLNSLLAGTAKSFVSIWVPRPA